MDNLENKDMFDLGSAPVAEDFDPFAMEEEAEDAVKEDSAQLPQENHAAQEQAEEKPAGNTAAVPASVSAAKTKAEKAAPNFAEKPPVFAYAGVTENIADVSMTFEELRIEKSRDFPELEDGKRVSWTVEYGKVVKTVADPKGSGIGRVKTDIEASKEFMDSLKKAKDKNPVCKIKPRVIAQSKGTQAAYKGVFATMEEAEKAGKPIAIVPSSDGKVYEIRNTEMGRFVTLSSGCDMLSEVRAGFIPALPRIPWELTAQIMAFFRYFVRNGSAYEALLNIYWDKEDSMFIADAPKQVVTGVSVDSRISEAFTEERYIHYMDIHSHNTMEAFFSPVDDHDEKATRLYTVVGRLDRAVPQMRTRISNGGKFLDIDPAEVFELSGMAFPDVWKEQVSVNSQRKRAGFKEQRILKREKRFWKKAGVL